MLALVGSGEYLPDMETVDRFLLDELGTAPRVVCLPTAAGSEGPQRIAYWSELGVNYFARLGASAEALPVITRQDAQNPILADRVKESNFIYLSGGRPDYLLKTLQDSLVWQAIQDVLIRGGILAGCSAGAMVLGRWIPGFPGMKPAFNLLEEAIVLPHFDEIPNWMVRLILIWVVRRGRMVGVPGFTALVVKGDACRVVGKGNVTIWDSSGKQDYTPGDLLAWSTRTTMGQNQPD